MFTATLLTDPARALEPAALDALRRAWGGGPARWLDVSAAEFDLPEVPGNRAEVWSDMQARGIDLAVQPAEGRGKRMLIADMDSTMIGEEGIDELADLAGVRAEVSALTERTMRGEIDFEAALRARVKLLAGLGDDCFDRVLARSVTYTPGGAALVATMKAHGAHTALLSGGFTGFTGPVAARLGFDEHHANTLLVADGRLTGEVGDPVLTKDAKVMFLERIAAALGLAPAAAVAVGDGANDVGMIGRAGLGVGYRPKPVLAAATDIRILHGDLTGVLFLQGIPHEAFA